MSAAGGSGVSVSIAGNASSLQAAINQTTAALNTLNAAINQTVGPSGNAAAAAQNQAAALNSVSAAANQAAAATNQQSAAQNNAAAAANQATAANNTATAATNTQAAAISQAIAAYNNSTAAINYVQSATQVLGSAQAQANIAWANAATSAEDYRQRLSLLEAQLRNVQAAQGDTNDSADLGFQRMLNLGSSVDGLNGSLFGAVLQFGDFDAVLGGAAGPIGLLIGLGMGLSSGLADLGENVVSLAENLGEDLVSAAEQAAQALEGLLEQTFQLADATEKNYFNWAFIWGGVNQQTGLGPGQPIANELLQWSKKASLQMPFTRQDLLQAITTLSVMGGQSPGTVETDLGLLSDIASTQGRPGLTLSWAAMAALRGGEGYSRMLLMDLNISKNELEKFGYDEKDPSSFFPALKLYEQARGEYGASAYTSQNTFWGASTSLTDRLQNFGLAVAGWNDNPQKLTDDVFKNSLFGGLKQDLLDLNKEIDVLNNNGVLPHIADLFSKTLGGGVNDARVALTGFADALGASGIYDFLFGVQTTTKTFDPHHLLGHKITVTHGQNGLFTDLAQFANSSQVQGFLRDVGDVLGSVIGPGMKDAAQGAEAFMTALGNTGIGNDILYRLSQVAQWLADPATQEGIKAFATAFASIVGTGAQDVLMAAQSFLQGVTGTGAGGTALDSLQGVAQWLADPAHQAQIRQAAYMLGTDLAAGFQLAVAGAKSLIDALGGVITLLGDLANLMVDQATGNWVKEGQDAAKFWNDVHNINVTLFSDFQNLATAANNAAKAANQAPPFAAGAAGGNSPPIGSKAWQEHMAKVLAAGGLDESGTPQAMTLAMTSAANQGGQQFAQTYLASAQNVFAKQQNGSQLVSALVTGLQQQITSGGDALGQTLYAVIDTHTRAVVTQMLRNYDLFGNADMRQPGAYSMGITMGYR